MYGLQQQKLELISVSASVQHHLPPEEKRNSLPHVKKKANAFTHTKKVVKFVSNIKKTVGSKYSHRAEQD
jgi:hypothetical protein